MNEKRREQVITSIERFEADANMPIEDVQVTLQSVLTLWQRDGASEDFDAIDRAENDLEEILFARLRTDQRAEAITRLGALREQLLRT